jgi:ribosomal protein S18 acetylase RimI-like enzyme
VISLQNIFASEIERAYAVYQETMKEYIGRAWGWVEKNQRKGFYSQDLESIKSIRSDSNEIGFLVSWVEEDTLYIKLLMIQKAYQGQGFGEKTLGTLLSSPKAKKATKIKGRVLKCNPSILFSQKMGFSIISSDDICHEIEKTIEN